MKPCILFFDMDGTLVDTEPIHYRSYAELMREYGISFPEHLFSSFVGKSTLANVQWLKQQYQLKENEIVLAARKKEYFTGFLEHISLFPNVLQLLTAAAQKYPLTLITSTKHNLTTKILETTQLRCFFSHIVTGDDGLPKPDPSLYRVALQKGNARATHVVAFEDSISGYDAATAAGILCHCIPNVYTKEQFSPIHPTFFSLEEALREYL